MFSRTVSLNRKVSCGTKPIWRRSDSRGYSRTGLPSIHTVPGVGIVNPRNQADQRGLARPGRADDGQAAARGNSQIDVVQNGHAVVGEVQPAKLDLPSDLCGSCASPAAFTSGLSSISGFSTRISLMRPMDAVPRWKILITQPSAITGQVSCTM